MALVSTLGRGAASGMAGALVWAAIAVLFLGGADPRRAAAAGVALALVVAAMTGLVRLR
jgi:hypothetical protein